MNKLQIMIAAILVVMQCGCAASTLNVGQGQPMNEQSRDGIAQPEGEVGTGTHSEGLGGII